MSKLRIRALVAFIIVGAMIAFISIHSARKKSATLSEATKSGRTDEARQDPGNGTHETARSEGAGSGSDSESDRGLSSIGSSSGSSSQGEGTPNSGSVAGSDVGGVKVVNPSVSFSGQGGVNAGNIAVGAPGAGANPAAAVQQQPAPPSCYSITFHHKHMLTHDSDEACSQHKNVIKLGHADVNVKSVCVRVNGTPVRFQASKKHKDEILIGAIAGPEAKIVATYCTGKLTCADDCSVPKDAFMDAIGGSEDGLKGAVQVGNWDTGDDVDAKNTAKLNHDLKRELADIDDSAPGTSAGTSIFRDWISDAETPACGVKQAKAEGQN